MFQGHLLTFTILKYYRRLYIKVVHGRKDGQVPTFDIGVFILL